MWKDISKGEFEELKLLPEHYVLKTNSSASVFQVLETCTENVPHTW